MATNTLNEAQQAYPQAKKYGEELAKLFEVERTRRRQLEVTTQKLQAIFDTAPNAVAMVDNDLNLVEANPRFFVIFETTPDCIGQPLGNFLPTDELYKTIRASETLTTGLGNVEVEITDPVYRTILITLGPLSNGQGWVLILHDLTERKRLEGLKDEFVNIAAHELRTPLAGVIGFVGVLQEELRDNDNPMADNLMDLILQSSHRLKTIIDELVSFAATRRGSNENLHVSNINLNGMLAKTVKFLQEHLEAKNVSCTLDLPEDVLIIQGDQFILSEVMYQLIRNAAIFNKDNGQITIRASYRPFESIENFTSLPETITAYEEVTVIDIEDTGIGIPRADLKKIFDRFYQVEEHLTRGIGGLGLGLTIARNGIERHTGHIAVTSELGKGSQFRIILPPIDELTDISIDNRVDVAYQQTLIYAQEIARAVASQRKVSRKIDQVKSLSADLSQKLQDLSKVEPGSKNYQDVFSQVQRITQEFLKLSDSEAT